MNICPGNSIEFGPWDFRKIKGTNYKYVTKEFLGAKRRVIKGLICKSLFLIIIIKSISNPEFIVTVIYYELQLLNRPL